jgi:hypothetical protein
MTEQKHIIDNKVVLMTADEFKLYEEICRSLDDPPQQKGRDFFQNLFEANEQGMIQFLRPPTNTCTYEVFLFMVSLFVQQRLREAAKSVAEMKTAINAKLGVDAKSVNDRIAALEKKVAEVEGKIK